MKYLVDSDFWFGLFVAGDANHTESKKIFSEILKTNDSLFCLRLVVYETATVLSYKIDQKASRVFVKKFPFLSVSLVDVDEELERKSWEIFERQTKKGTSFIDCANLAAKEKYRFDGILSFDKFYPATFKNPIPATGR